MLSLTGMVGRALEGGVRGPVQAPHTNLSYRSYRRREGFT